MDPAASVLDVEAEVTSVLLGLCLLLVDELTNLMMTSKQLWSDL